MRDKMRSLDNHIKADFIKQDKAESQSGSYLGSSPSASGPGEVQPKSHEADHAARSHTTAATTPRAGGVADQAEATSTSKRTRPRSRTFTFRQGDKGDKESGSPVKKQKGDGNAKGKGLGLKKSNSSKSLSSMTGSVPAADVVGSSKAAVPEDFVVYLQKVRKPEQVEVGRMHKLRLVLRNERVAWVDSFITMGGMTEIVGLLDRIMAIEWKFVSLS